MGFVLPSKRAVYLLEEKEFGMKRLTLAEAAVGVCLILVLGSVPSLAQGVQLISPANGSTISRLGPMTLKWQPYSGALAYRCWNKNTDGLTYPGNESNPHLVSSGKTEFSIFWTVDSDWDWYIIAYSDSAGLNEIARSVTWSFHARANVTPTPTPVETNLDFNEDGKEDSLDLFYFARIWQMDSSMPNRPAYFNNANLVLEENLQNPEVIDASDLAALKGVFRERGGPAPTPGLPAPVLVRPSNNARTTVPEYSNAIEFYAWSPLAGADHFEIEMQGPGQHPLRSFKIGRAHV